MIERHHPIGTAVDKDEPAGRVKAETAGSATDSGIRFHHRI
jgi:hypothetical protein